MARTDTRRSNDPVKVDCPLPGFQDEWHLIRPSIRGALTDVRDKSQARDWDKGQLVYKTDPNLFDQNHLDWIWAGWSDTVEVVLKTGEIQAPAQVTLENKLNLVNNRPMEFFLWLQDTSQEIARALSTQQAQERETFHTDDQASAGLPEAQL